MSNFRERHYFLEHNVEYLVEEANNSTYSKIKEIYISLLPKPEINHFCLSKY